ncbi:adenylate cyclase [Spirochaetia bacterium]|nr:adenylate cyclase [Spirochaetia bacterium]GHV49366.1 adenylate cyclase [Spirochaetia bacterium]
MAFEIELKAWVDDPLNLKERLNTLGEYECAYEKNDTYWILSVPGTGSIPQSGVRVRREQNIDADGRSSERVPVTYKVKEILDGIEVNDEREFEVSDGKVFEELLERFGLSPLDIKRKKGWAWNCTLPGEPPVRAELSEVEGLGWFIEPEIITNNNDEKTVSAGRNRLLSLLDSLGIPKDRIESRTYTGMLRDLAQKQS